MPELKARSVMSPLLKKVLNSEDVVVHTAPPVFQRTGREVPASAGTAKAARDAPASRPAARRENTGRQISTSIKKLAPSIRNADTTQSLKNWEALREPASSKRDTLESTIQANSYLLKAPKKEASKQARPPKNRKRSEKIFHLREVTQGPMIRFSS